MLKFNRNYQLKFTIGTRDGHYHKNPEKILIIEPPLTLNFEVSRQTYGGVNTCNIQLLNLNEDTKAFLYKDRFVKDKYIDLQFFAGYNDEMPLIFYGEVQTGISYKRSGTTDFVTELELSDGGYGIQYGYVSATFGENLDPDGIIKAITDTNIPSVKMGVVAPIPYKNTRRKTTVLGNSWDIINKLSSSRAFIDNGVLHVLGEDDTIEGDTTLINIDTGLLGSPVKTDRTLELTTIFEPSIKVGQLIKLESVTFPYLSGFYKIIGFKHSGTISMAECGQLITNISLYIRSKATEPIKPQKQEQVIESPTSFIKPVEAQITSKFGYRERPTAGASTFHKGLDYGCPLNTPVKASYGGVVTQASYNGGYGRLVVIDHGNFDNKPCSTYYAHLNTFNVSVGQKVNQGDTIALSGGVGPYAGASTGPHLHFAIHLGGSFVDPTKFVGN